MKKIYFDYASTSPLDPEALKAMLPFLKNKFGNATSLHSFGTEAKEALEKSREEVAGLIGADPEEIIFTSSATESNNFALKGIAFANKKKGNHIIISSIEHPCILESAKWLEGQGFEITYLPVDIFGKVSLEALKKEIKKETILVSIIHASNEIGTIQPIVEIGKICKDNGVLFHTDAAQSFGKISINVKEMNIDLLTASSHKMYGPKGAACLFIREGVKIEPLLHGGNQEGGKRSSTANVAAIVGFAKACQICKKTMAVESKRLISLRDYLIKKVLQIDGSYLNGDPKDRLPNNANFRFSFIEGESLLMKLDILGIAVSTGSACSSLKLEPSHVLMAIGLKPEEAHGSLRISIGRWTKKEEIDYFVKSLGSIVKELRNISPFKS
jgi:cysteine desulfurase